MLTYSVAFQGRSFSSLGLKKDHQSLLEVYGPIRFFLGQSDLFNGTSLSNLEHSGHGQESRTLFREPLIGGQLKFPPVVVTLFITAAASMMVVRIWAQQVVNFAEFTISDFHDKLVCALDLEVDGALDAQSRVLRGQLGDTGEQSPTVHKLVIMIRLPFQFTQGATSG